MVWPTTNIFGGVVSGVTSAAYWSYKFLQTAWDARGTIFHVFLYSIVAWIAYVFDVSHVVRMGAQIVRWIFELMEFAFQDGSTGQAALERMQSIMSDGVVVKCIGLSAYFMDVFISPTLVFSVLGFLVYAWAVGLVVRTVLYVKGHFWSASD